MAAMRILLDQLFTTDHRAPEIAAFEKRFRGGH